jgi:glutathione S-transferase
MSNELGSTADNPIRLWDRMDILKYLESRYGEDFFINGERVVKTSDNREVKLIQMKLDSGEYKNIYFCNI